MGYETINVIILGGIFLLVFYTLFSFILNVNQGAYRYLKVNLIHLPKKTFKIYFLQQNLKDYISVSKWVWETRNLQQLIDKVLDLDETLS